MDSVSEKNLALAETVKAASVVAATDLRGEAVIIRKSGRVVDTRRSSRADKIRACFTLAPNPVAQAGDRLIYVQVINPNNALLGAKAEIEFEEGTLLVSKVTKVFYENEELDVCSLIDAKEENLIEGRYVINVFDGPKQVATTTLDLK